MKIAFSPVYSLPLPPGHRFPMLKYELLPEQLLREGLVDSSDFFQPSLLPWSVAAAVHNHAYVHKLKTLDLTHKEIRRIGFPLSSVLVERERVIAQGSVDNALLAIEKKISFNVAGGTHHAYAEHGEGFCVLNDIAVAASFLLNKGLAERILVIDLDVHQGNGTAHIFKDDNRVFTFSMHGANNYPLHKENSNLDLALADGITDRPYLALLERHLQGIFESFEPQVVFYQSGVDVLESDKLGRLALSPEGAKMRDRLVFEYCKQADIGVAVSMGGGYSAKLSDIVDAHVRTFEEAIKVYG